MSGGEFITSRSKDTTIERDRSAARTFHIYGVSTPEAAEADTAIPIPRLDRFPGDASLVATDERRTRIMEGCNDVFIVETIYRSAEKVTLMSGGLQTVAKKVYRTDGATALIWPIDLSAPSNLTTVGGIAVDVEGQQTDRWHKLVRFQLSDKVMERPPIDMFLQMQNSRNKSPFYGFPKQVVLYEGLVSFQENGDGSWSLQHSFIADEWAHLEQQTWRQADGKPFMTGSSIAFDGTTIVVRQATHVFWYQPFPETSDFGRLGVGE